jgi:hypothetical protein
MGISSVATGGMTQEKNAYATIKQHKKNSRTPHEMWPEYKRREENEAQSSSHVGAKKGLLGLQENHNMGTGWHFGC